MASSPAGKMILTVMAGIADFERSLILERTATGRKAAQARGVKFGRTRALTDAQLSAAKLMLQQPSASGHDRSQSLQGEPEHFVQGDG